MKSCEFTSGLNPRSYHMSPPGCAVEWDLPSSAVKEHNIHDSSVDFLAMSGDRIIASTYGGPPQVFDVQTCLLRLVRVVLGEMSILCS